MEIITVLGLGRQTSPPPRVFPCVFGRGDAGHGKCCAQRMATLFHGTDDVIYYKRFIELYYRTGTFGLPGIHLASLCGGFYYIHLFF